ncbi:MAG: hypothetical protein ABI467_09305 [Kofleriaceae bacterium]
MTHTFKFFRAGGVDQVAFGNGDDMLAVGELDQKLWVALAMPVKGVDIDAETLALLDHDGDGRIRVQDIVAAAAWVKTTFKKPADLLTSSDTVQLSAIADPKVLGAAKRMLADLKKTDQALTIADTIAINKAFADTVLNGDGIVIPASTQDAELRKVIEDAIAAVGSVVDLSGKPGINKELATLFFAGIDERAAWISVGRDPVLAPLGAGTEAAATAFAAVRDKIDDYFTRCRIAAYDPRGVAALAGTEPELLALTSRMLNDGDAQLAQLPLSKIDPIGKLGFGTGLNPAWADRMEAFLTSTVKPILGARDSLTRQDLAVIDSKLAEYRLWRGEQPATKVDALDPGWVETLAKPELRAKLDALIADDFALADDYAQITAVTKTVRLQRDFLKILRNFVNFSDFYSKQDGVFQAGTLYLDARALHLCVPVSDAGKHGLLASASDACLLYCDITRRGVTKQIAAALTNGDTDSVFVGRNGIFYDREGNDWDATIVKIISNPISVRAAFWAPYKKLIRTIEEGVQKRAQAAESASNAKMEATGNTVAVADKKALDEAEQPEKPDKPDKPDKTEAPTKIDLGTVAAIGVAIGGIGTLFGALFGLLFGLGFWLPIGIVALILMISGPSMLLAWLKLRRRNLGPILDANGWAINGRARINVAFGAAMTELAKLPPGAKRSLDDPFADKKTPWRRWVFLIIVLGLGGGWYLGKFDKYLPASATSIGVLGENAPAAKKLKAQAEPAAPAPAAPAPASPAPAAK